ncbi:mucin-2-like [Armigeres subalbatus]|uniref:mucin-2-like n=1 Tax=Armigeres subalbatus TaxID=124917 RepID=UPI002ED286B6
MEESLRRNAELQNKLDRIIGSQLLQTATTPQPTGTVERDSMDDTLTSIGKPEGPSPAKATPSPLPNPPPRPRLKLTPKPRRTSGDTIPKQTVNTVSTGNSTPTSITKVKVSLHTSGFRVAGKSSIAIICFNPIIIASNVPQTPNNTNTCEPTSDPGTTGPEAIPLPEPLDRPRHLVKTEDEETKCQDDAKTQSERPNRPRHPVDEECKKSLSRSHGSRGPPVRTSFSSRNWGTISSTIG